MVKFLKRLDNVIRCLTCQGYTDYSLNKIKEGYYPYTTINIVGRDKPIYLKSKSFLPSR